jgi:hypothetical protein
MSAASDEAARAFRTYSAHHSNLIAPRVVSSRRPVSSCHSGGVGVKRRHSAVVNSLRLVTAIASRRFDLGEHCQVEIDDGFERLSGGTFPQAVGQPRKPFGIFSL